MTAARRLPAPARLVAALGVSVTLCLGVAACGSGSGSHSSGPTSTTAAAGETAVNSLLAEGIRQAESKMVSQAETTFENVLLLSPHNVYAFYNLGLIDQDRNDATGALSYYDQALASDPTYTPAMYNKALLLEATDLDEALALYQRIVAIDPKASTAYLRMAIVYSEQGKATQATTARTKAIALDPSLASYPLPAKCATPNC